jgi:hypothetical protein
MPRACIQGARVNMAGLWGAAALFVSACAGKPPVSFDVQIKVESDPGRPLAGVRLLRDGRSLAQTDERGSALLQLSGAPGEVVALSLSCPSGFRSPDAPLAVVLRPLLERRVPQYRASCAPLLRSLVVAVRAQNGPDLPLKYLGKEIARTDLTGAGHALLSLPPGETATLTLDTSGPGHERLLPRSPELKLTVPERDELVVFDQTFTREVEKTVRAKKAKHLGPTRI